MKNSEFRIQESASRRLLTAYSLRLTAFGLLLSAFILHPSSFILSAPVPATVKSTTGQVEYAKPGEAKFQPLRGGESLAAGSTIKTGIDGVAIIVAVPGAAIRVGPNSQLTLNEMDFSKEGQKVTSRKATLDLKSGTVSALINKNDPQTTDFKIKTPQGVAAARGTFYAVTVEGENSFVAVKEGNVGLQKSKKEEGKGSTGE